MTERFLWTIALAAVAVLPVAAVAQTPSPPPSGSNVVLNGKQEVPTVTTDASGSGTITVLMDRSVSGAVTTTGIAATAAHIHLAAPGQNGPVIVPLNKTGDNVWSVPTSIRFNDPSTRPTGSATSTFKRDSEPIGGRDSGTDQAVVER
jgi:hypothetical protein